MIIQAIKPVRATGSNIWVYLGFAPEYVEVYDFTNAIVARWHRFMGNDAGLNTAPDADNNNADITNQNSGNGISLVQMENPGIELSSNPSTVIDPTYGDGLLLPPDLGNTEASVSSGDLLYVIAYRATEPLVLATDDGGSTSNNYLEDSSKDFVDLGVPGGQQWIGIDVTNGNYAYLGNPTVPAQKTKAYRIPLTDAAGNQISSGISSSGGDWWLMPAKNAQYPLSDLTQLT